MEEKIITWRRNIKVTTARLIIDGKEYLLNDVTHVKICESPSWPLTIIFFSAGVYLVVTMGLVAIIYPASIFFGLAAISAKTKLMHQVKLITPNKEVVSYTSNNKSNAREVADLITNALQRR